MDYETKKVDNIDEVLDCSFTREELVILHNIIVAYVKQSLKMDDTEHISKAWKSVRRNLKKELNETLSGKTLEAFDLDKELEEKEEEKGNVLEEITEETEEVKED
jgi:hypothetical protein